MADSSSTVGELFKAKAVTDEQVNAAVEAYLATPETGAKLRPTPAVVASDPTWFGVRGC